MNIDLSTNELNTFIESFTRLMDGVIDKYEDKLNKSWVEAGKLTQWNNNLCRDIHDLTSEITELKSSIQEYKGLNEKLNLERNCLTIEVKHIGELLNASDKDNDILRKKIDDFEQQAMDGPM